MVTPFFFGNPDRRLAGVLHAISAADKATAQPVVIVPPLLQEAIAAHRCLWWLAEKLAAEGAPVLRFDAHSTGDSAGDSVEMSLEGLRDDTLTALAWMQAHSNTGEIRQLAFRSASIPALQSASLAVNPVDLVLWDPVLSGSALASEWSAQHLRQLTQAGRYPFHPAAPEACDLLGFELAPEFLPALSGFDATNCVLPAGSRLRIALWQADPTVDEFVQEQQQSGVDADVWMLDAPDRPDWNDALKYEDQVFPRRSTMLLAGLLKEQSTWA